MKIVVLLKFFSFELSQKAILGHYHMKYKGAQFDIS